MVQKLGKNAFYDNNNMKEEQKIFQCNRRLLKRHTTVDKVPNFQDSPSKTLPLAVTVISMNQSPQKQNRIHQPISISQTMNCTYFGDKKMLKASRFKVEQYNDLQGDKVENSKVEKKNNLFKIKTMNIAARVRYKKQEKQEYLNLFGISTFTQDQQSAKRLKKCQTMDIFTSAGKENMSSIPQRLRKATLQMNAPLFLF